MKSLKNMGNKSITRLLEENDYNIDLVSRLAKVPLNTVKHIRDRLVNTNLIKAISVPIQPPKSRFACKTMKINSKFNFGKYKGQMLFEIIKSDNSYILWALETGLIKLDKSVKFIK